MQRTGESGLQADVRAVIEHVLADRPGEWRVSIVGPKCIRKVLHAGGFGRRAPAGSDPGHLGEDAAGEEGMIEDRDCAGLYWCPGLTLELWHEECRLVEERFSLFRPFAELPFFGFRGIVARAGSEYRVTVAAEMDMYPKYQPWVVVTPTILGAREDGKLSLDVSWSPEGSRFADVIGAVIAHVEAVLTPSSR